MAAKGFLTFPRMENPFRDTSARLQDFGDLHIPLSQAKRQLQASRCMNCGVPFCQSDFGCPLHNLIPEWNQLLEAGQEHAALIRLMKTAPFPEFTGRVCPALCEKACNLADDGVTNRDNELYLIETGFKNGWIRPAAPSRRSGCSVAIVGSGPSGLAAADLLNRLGHTVTVFERADRPGGLLMYGIPNMKLPKDIVMRRIDLMQQSVITFCLNIEASASLCSEFDAVLLCSGARTPRSLHLPNDHLPGVLYAVDFLSEVTRSLLDHQTPPSTVTDSVKGKSVIVVGGGDTGNDCVGTVLRLGAAQVTQLEMMPKPPVSRLPANPWPEWPRTLRTDYGQLESLSVTGHDPRIYETTVKSIHPDKQTDKRFEPFPGTEQRLPCDLLLIAAGFTGCDQATAHAFSLVPDSRGRLAGENGLHYLGGNLFSAGDARTGQSLVVRALADGRACAAAVHDWLSGRKK